LETENRDERKIMEEPDVGVLLIPVENQYIPAKETK